jgi:hypothetical protein
MQQEHGAQQPCVVHNTCMGSGAAQATHNLLNCCRSQLLRTAQAAQAAKATAPGSAGLRTAQAARMQQAMGLHNT